MANKFKFKPNYSESNSLFRNNWAIDVTDANTGGGPSATTELYNGVNIPVGGWAVYTPAGTVFTANNSTELQEYSKSFGGSGGTVEDAVYWLSNNGYIVLDSDIKPTFTDGLILHLEPNSASFDGRDWNDLSGQGNNARLAGGRVNWNSEEGSLKFDGSSWFQIEKSASMDAWANNQTVAIWMKHNFTSGRRNPWDQAYGGYGTWTHEHGNNINNYFGDAGKNGSPYTSLNSGGTSRDQWNLLVLTREGNTAKWYVNGTHTATRTHGYGSLTATNAPVRIGRGYAGLWIGDMKQVQAWNRALSQQEIQQLKAWQS